MAESTAELVAAAKARIENLSAAQVAGEIEDGDVVLVDLREREEQLQQGVIPGSVSAPRGMLEFWADPTGPYHREEFDPGRRTILYCASGGRSALGAETLQRLGYRSVAHLDGGYRGWKESGHAVEDAPPAAN